MNNTKLLILAVVGVVILGALYVYLGSSAATSVGPGPPAWPAAPVAPTPFPDPGAAPPRAPATPPVTAPAVDPCAGVRDADAGSPVLMARCRQASCNSAVLGAGSCACINSRMPDPDLAAACCVMGGAGRGCSPGAWLQYTPI